MNQWNIVHGPHSEGRKQKKQKRVGLQGFEPWTSCTRNTRATKLRYSPFGNGYVDARGRREQEYCVQTEIC
jgi:hypothetical protein